MLERNASSKGISHLANADWAAQEFAHASLPDARLVKRLITIASDFGQQPTASLPQACGSWGKAKAAYRFFDHEAIRPEDILASHVQCTRQRVAAHAYVLCVQDTTSLNYSTHPQTQGLGPIGNNPDKTIGLFLHSTLALDTSGQPLGLLHAQTWVRSTRHFGRSAHERNRTPRQEKESQKWMDSLSACQEVAAACAQTTLVNVADREGDLYDLFVAGQASADQPQVHLLVRAQHDRQVAHPQKYLWDFLGSQPVAGQLKIKVPAKNGQPGRLATLSVRWASVTLRPPCLKEEQPPLRMQAIEAREMRPPKGATPVCWRLLTTLPVNDLQGAEEKIRWYAQRWQIEVLHKVLKSGCKVEQRQLETAARLQRVIRVDLVVAWRVLSLCKAGRQAPAGLASDWLSTEEWQALWCYRHEKATPPSRPPSVQEAVRWIAQLGGFLGRKRDGEPGSIVVWRGLQQLQAITMAWKRFSRENCG